MPRLLQVAVEARLVDRVDRGQAHRDRRELPEVRHQPRVGVRRQPGAGPCCTSWRNRPSCSARQPLHQVGAGVDAGGGVALDVELVAAAGVVLAAEEVVVADLVEARGRGVRRDVAADLEALAVGRGDHHRGVPADQPADLPLHLLVAGEPRLALGRDGVDEVGAAQGRDADLLLAGPLEQPQHDVAGTLATVRRRRGRRTSRATPGSPRGRCPGAGWAGPRGSRRGLCLGLAGTVGGGRGWRRRDVSLTRSSCHASHGVKSERPLPASRLRGAPGGGRRGLRSGRGVRWTTAHHARTDSRSVGRPTTSHGGAR